jgi:hypothetical protein
MASNFENLIKALKSAVRTGRTERGEQQDWDLVRDQANELRKLAKNLPMTTNVLEAFTLCAEFQDLSRAPENQVSFFKEVVWPHGGDFDLDFDQWFKMVTPLDENINDRRERLRQMSWALMQLVWLHAYRASDYPLALKLLERIREFIKTFRDDKEFPCLGTLARWHFIYGECHRASRRFPDAEQSFLESQALLHRRLQNRLERYGSDRLRIDSEIRFSSISTARILTFLGWSEVQTGKLTRGSQLLASAATLVEGTGPDYTRLFVQTRRAIALRRLVTPDYGAAGRAFEQLNAMNAEYEKRQHDRGRIRCLLEICRGHVDILEFGPDRERARALQDSRETLARLKEIVNSNSPWAIPVRLLEVRLNLLLGDVPGAKALWAQSFGEHKHSGEFSSNRISVIKALLLARDNKLSDAIELLSRLVENIIDDPVAESECRLRLAECCIEAGADSAQAQKQIDRWRTLSANVENSYLKALGDRVTGRLREWETDFIIRFKDDDLDAGAQTDRLQMWLVTAARARLGKNATLAKLGEELKKDQSTLSRWLNPKRKDGPEKR